MSKSELDVEENKSETVGVNRAGEGAFPPTPAEPAQIVKAVKEELDRIMALDRAVVGTELANRIEAAVTRVLGQNFDAEYYFDEYPRTTLYIRHQDRLCVEDIEWRGVEAIDVVKILNKEKDVIAEVLVSYVADELLIGVYDYIKIEEIKEINVEVVRE
jgi:hypothetical protein